MKLNKILLGLAAFAVLFTSCKSDDVTGITLDKSTLALETGGTSTLKASILPSGASGTITWATSDKEVATVNNGEVTAVGEGTADITASVDGFSAKCTVTVTAAPGDYSSSLKGSDYYLISMDDASAAKIASKVKLDLRTDDVSRFLYVWNGTYNPGTPTGPNFYGEVVGWTSFTVGSAGWSGAGFFCSDLAKLNELSVITANPNDYYLHIGIKSKDNATHVFGLDGQSSAKFAVGPTPFVDNGTTYQPIANFTRNGEWQQIEIPVSTLKTNGLLYSNSNTEGKNLFWFLSGGTTGVTLDLDAVFIYKKVK